MHKLFFLISTKIFLIIADTYVKNCINTLRVDKKENGLVSWINMHDIQDTLGVKTCLI